MSDATTITVRVDTALRDRLEAVAALPTQSGRPGRVAGTRELLVAGAPYVVAYRVNGAVIDILGVLHTARRWPEAF
ncbi:MAG: addiction module toxin, RelE/StbE family [Hyphomicrobiales bacterium]|jgi:plasmid stabilization system protein ParE|nr:addiction module toxin, RelE/StbE family [Hyphomicrobiales bacterium]